MYFIKPMVTLGVPKNKDVGNKTAYSWIALIYLTLGLRIIARLPSLTERNMESAIDLKEF